MNSASKSAARGRSKDMQVSSDRIDEFIDLWERAFGERITRTLPSDQGGHSAQEQRRPSAAASRELGGSEPARRRFVGLAQIGVSNKCCLSTQLRDS
jgi:hypothetical protein